jgi:hypothetical protein
MRGVATLGIMQYGEYRLSAKNNSGESTKNRKYLFESEVKFGKPFDTEKGAWEETIPEKSATKNVGLSL